ncbi:DUF222 domain-containing protein [Micrococcoides hystricis]|uniref:DUF222 domain-containing protein n=1 Tax=Micrococcoides hystricis TaxID=1572761 RepID=A0ABV6PCB7_9MICC
MDPQTWLAAINDAAEISAADSPWVLEAEDHLAGFLYAQRIRRVHRKMVAIAQEDSENFTSDQLTVAYLEANNAVFRRKVETSLLQGSTLTKSQASELLLHSANLHQHAPELLDLLEQGKTTVAEATLMAQKLRTIRPPKKTQKPDGDQWQPGEFEAATRATEEAKNALGEGLTKLAGSKKDLPDIQHEAEQLRHRHHPESAQQRHRAANQTRHVRITPAPDGMAHLFARISADDGTKIQQALAAAAQQLAADGSAADGSAAGRTRTQLEADLLVDALAQTRSPANGSGAAPASSGSREPKPHSQASLPGLELSATPANGVSPGNSTSGVTVMVLATLSELVNLGGTVDPDRMGFLRQHYPDLWAQAERNRVFYQTPPAERETTHPPGVLEAGASVKIVGSSVQPGTKASAELIGSSEFWV